MRDLPDPLRPARPDDAATIAAYHRRCWQTSFRSITSPEVLAFVEGTPIGTVIETWERRTAPDASEQTVVAVDATDRPIGHVMVLGAELVHLFIDPDHHRAGWGQVLLGVGEALISDAGHPIAELHTMVDNRPAIALYEANGWVVTDAYVTNDLPNGSRFIEHVLRKELHPDRPG